MQVLCHMVAITGRVYSDCASGLCRGWRRTICHPDAPGVGMGAQLKVKKGRSGKGKQEMKERKEGKKEMREKAKQGLWVQ